MGELRFTFNPEKAGQAAAFLLKRSGGKISKGHLVKMLYGADWSQLRHVGVPITGDQPVSMPQGPVLSGVLNLLNGKKRHPFWNRTISQATRDNYSVNLLDHNPPADLLTEREKRTLERVHDFFAPKSWEEVKAACYRIFKEWKDPKGSQQPIAFEDMLLVSGKKNPEFVEELVALQREQEVLQKLFA